MKKFIAIVLSLVLVFSFAACAAQNTEVTSNDETDLYNEEQLQFTFIAVDLEGNETSFDVPYSEGDMVGEALVAEGLIAGEEGDYGLYVKTVNGLTLDYDTDGAYWAFYEGDDLAANGCDTTAIVAGTTYKFVATKG